MSWCGIGVGLLASLVLAACDFSGRLAGYCDQTGYCTCEPGPCCINAGNQCEDGLCCDGLTCGSGTCVEKVAQLQVQPSKTSFPYVVPGNDDTAPIHLTNVGYDISEPVSFTLTGDADQFTFVGGTCDHQQLGIGGTCLAELVFTPTRGGDFHVDLHVLAGSVEKAVQGFDGTSVATVQVAVSHSSPDIRILSDPPAIDCVGGDGGCEALVPLGSVHFTESHDAGTDITGWVFIPQISGDVGGSCGATSTCSLWITGPGALLVSYQPWLSQDSSILGGWVSSDPPGFDCGGDSNHRACWVAMSGPVKLYANPLAGHTFLQWNRWGACADAGTATECDLDLTGPVHELAPEFR